MSDKKSILLNFSVEQWSEVEAYTNEVEALYKTICLLYTSDAADDKL